MPVGNYWARLSYNLANLGMAFSRYFFQCSGCQISTQTAAPTTITSPPASTARNSLKPSGMTIRPRCATGTVRKRLERSRPKRCTSESRVSSLPIWTFCRISSTPASQRVRQFCWLHKLRQPRLSLTRTHSFASGASKSINSLGMESRYRSSRARTYSPRIKGVCDIGLSSFFVVLSFYHTAMFWARYPQNLPSLSARWDANPYATSLAFSVSSARSPKQIFSSRNPMRNNAAAMILFVSLVSR